MESPLMQVGFTWTYIVQLTTLSSSVTELEPGLTGAAYPGLPATSATLVLSNLTMDTDRRILSAIAFDLLFPYDTSATMKNHSHTVMKWNTGYWPKVATLSF